jgi:hypothetical protein
MHRRYFLLAVRSDADRENAEPPGRALRSCECQHLCNREVIDNNAATREPVTDQKKHIFKGLGARLPLDCEVLYREG